MESLKLRCISGAEVEIEKLFYKNRANELYFVKHDGVKRVLRIYNSNYFDDSSKITCFYDRIKSMVKFDLATKGLIWPVDITELTNDSFGFVMNEIPNEYCSMDEIISKEVYMYSFKTLCTAAMKIAYIFSEVHNKGYSFCNIDEYSIFINPKTGDVIISNIDCINICGMYTDRFIDPRFAAPEVIIGGTPNVYSDYYLLATILFMFICHAHPFEGKKYIKEGLMSYDKKKDFYSKDAVFIMDKNDESNCCVPNIHKDIMNVWPFIPEYIRELFYRSFTKGQGFDVITKRPTEIEWIEAFAKYSNEIAVCPKCGVDIFPNEKNEYICDNGYRFETPLKINNNRYTIPLFQDTILYRCNLFECNTGDAMNLIGVVVTNLKNPKLLGIKNLTDFDWVATSPAGVQKVIRPGTVLPLLSGISVEIKNSIFEIT